PPGRLRRRPAQHTAAPASTPRRREPPPPPTHPPSAASRRTPPPRAARTPSDTARRKRPAPPAPMTAARHAAQPPSPPPPPPADVASPASTPAPARTSFVSMPDRQAHAQGPDRGRPPGRKIAFPCPDPVLGMELVVSARCAAGCRATDTRDEHRRDAHR